MADTQTNNLQMLHFGEDYRLFISSLSDSSVATQSRHRNKRLRRKNKRREVRLSECEALVLLVISDGGMFPVRESVRGGAG